MVAGYIIAITGATSLIAILITFASILSHLLNYRKPFQQRLVIRIHLIIPFFAVSCFATIVNPFVGLNILAPFREIYEAFVIYTFFSYLTTILGGERRIIIATSGREPIRQLPHVPTWILPRVDISNPYTFLSIKRGILQYVWIKPLLFLITIMSQALGVYDENDFSFHSIYFWISIMYNVTVSMSLYQLAMFWKCLYQDLKQFNPWSKFMCVKLIIFASYWQGLLLSLVNYFFSIDNQLTTEIENSLLCVEMVGFAILHWHAFNYEPFKKQNMPECGRLSLKYSIKDFMGIEDLIFDFRHTFNGDMYGYKTFDSVESIIAHPESKQFSDRILNKGMRYSRGSSRTYWLESSSLLRSESTNSYQSVQSHSSNNRKPVKDDFDPEQLVKDDKLYSYVKRHYPFGDPNCPVITEEDSYRYSRNFKQRRRDLA
ncbi:BA75_04729T0 [Komagataella pastoris]|uniref:BA75_04729T0 n=1 Tax=Komagataella pastoris TaxID=4922 RepID=A0A1B2JIZ0_PICPA|nr:BA75_04729T0 [Komagataella pastoris]